jgi:hypothetical protein
MQMTSTQQTPAEALVIRSIASRLREATEDIVRQPPPLRIRLMICHLDRSEAN